MKKPQLVIMAAGLGSRFGGLKQMASVDPQNHWIIDYSIFDAVRAGFGDIILIVKPENEQLFRDTLGKRVGGAAFTEDDGKTFTFLPNGTTVSMNFWGFTPDILKEIEGRFAAFLAENLPKNPLKCEYFLPLIPNQLIAEGKAKVRVLPCPEKWYGVTYQPDMPQVQAAIAQMKKDGLYPLSLWK